MREVTYYVAATLDGFIAREDGGISDFLWDDEYGAYLLEQFPETFPVHIRGDGFTKEQNRYFDSVLMGRKTYELGLNEGVTSPYPTLEQYVFSRTLGSSPDSSVELVASDPIETVRAMKSDPGRGIWLCGGGELAGLLLSAKLIDKIILKLNPVVFGTGIPLFRGEATRSRLALEAQKVFESGHLIVRYQVI